MNSSPCMDSMIGGWDWRFIVRLAMDIFACDVDMFKGMCLLGVSGAATALYAAVLVSCFKGFWVEGKYEI